jgi:hypothetical protein
MDRLRKFWRLDAGEQFVLVQAGLLLIAAEAGLRLVPFRSLLRWSQRGRARQATSRYPGPERAAELVGTAARLAGNLGGWLQPTCLRKSIALCVLLCRRGWDAHLVLGTGSVDGRFQAHAWVELDGKRLGADGASRYNELVAFAGPAAGQSAAGRQIA